MLFFHSSHDYFCHFLCEQLSATPLMPSKRDWKCALLSSFAQFIASHSVIRMAQHLKYSYHIKIYSVAFIFFKLLSSEHHTVYHSRGYNLHCVSACSCSCCINCACNHFLCLVCLWPAPALPWQICLVCLTSSCRTVYRLQFNLLCLHVSWVWILFLLPVPELCELTRKTIALVSV